MAPKFDIIVPLDLCVDCIADIGDIPLSFGQSEDLIENYTLELGGSSVIFASQAVKLGLKTAGVGRIGDDLLGRFIIERLNETGMDTRWVVTDPDVKTGLGIALNRGHDRTVITYTGSIDAVGPEDLTLERVLSARHLHIGSYFLTKKLQKHYPALLSQLSAHGVSVSVDTNWDPEEKWDSGLKSVLPFADVFFPNEAELNSIPYAGLAKRTVVKLGERGARTLSEDGRIMICPAIPVIPVDTIGAGDNFNAGYIYGFLQDLPTEQCLRYGVITGGKSTRKHGGIAGQIDRSELEKSCTDFFRNNFETEDA